MDLQLGMEAGQTFRLGDSIASITRALSDSQYQIEWYGEKWEASYHFSESARAECWHFQKAEGESNG